MKSTLIDSSIWVAYFNPDDKNHFEALRLMNRLLAIEKYIVLPEIVFVEVVNVIKRLHFDLNRIKEIEKFFEDNFNIKLIQGSRYFGFEKIKR